MARFKQKRVTRYWLAGVFCAFQGLFLPVWGQTESSTLFLNEDVTFEHYSLGQGLSNKTIRAIHQDREGFLWVGTLDGLNRFDGYRFTVFQTDSANEIPYTMVNFIHEDRAGRLWLATMNKGLCRFDKRTGKFTIYRIDSAGQNKRNTCLGLFEDRQDQFWLPSPGGLSKFDPHTGRFTLFPNPTPGEPIYVVHQDTAGGFWIGTNKGLFQFDPRTAKFTLFALSLDDREKAPAIRTIYQDRAGTCWIGTIVSGLFRLNTTTKQFIHYPYQKNGLTRSKIYKDAIVEDAAGMIWIGTDSGLQQLNPTTGQFTIYQAKASIPGGLQSNEIRSLHLDRSGLLWIGTAQGLHRLVPHPKKIRTYQFRSHPNDSQRLENAVGFLYEDRSGILWLTNEFPGGLYRYNWQTGHLNRYGAQPNDPQSLLSDTVRAVYEDQAGVLWVLAGKCLHALDQQTGRFTRYPMPIYCWLIGGDPAGQLWLGGEALARFDQHSGQFTYYRHNPLDSTSLDNSVIFPLLTSRSGAIWLGMATLGLSKFDPKTGRFTHYRPNFTHPAGHFNAGLTNSLYEDETGILWIGTAHGGLNRFDPQTETFTAYTTRDGLPTNSITGIVGDRSSNLWIATNQGLSRFNSRTKVFRNYDQRDGLQDNEFGVATCVQSRSGELFFGGPNGFNVFYPDSIHDNPRIPPVYITSFKVLDKPHLGGTKWIELSHRENFLSFEFVALNYVMPEKNQYAYQLVGVDKDWVYAGTRRFASYTNLDPGTYTFRVKGSNNDGVWNEKGATLHLLIRPPWWLTSWFITLSIIVTLGLLYGVFRYRIAQIRQEEAEKTESNKQQEEQKTAFNKKVSELEMQALRAQMNPHFIFNCLNSINRFILKNQPEAASDYLSKFSKLIRLILQNSNTPTVTLENELEALQLYLEMEALRFEGKFTFRIHCPEEVEADYTEIPPLVIQPYVENAIWHGLMHKEGTGHITVQVQQENEVLTCTIEDDGIGRQRAAALKSKSAMKSKSLGMQITAHRLELLNTLYGKQTTVEVVDLVDAGGEACGTRVVLSISV